VARGLSWSDVRGGLIATLIIVLVSVAILKFSRVGALHGDTIILYALANEARGVTPGSEVWLSGQKIGKITSITFRPASADTSVRLVIKMEVLAEYRPAVHRDAIAQIRAGGTAIGAPVMYLTPGTAQTTEIENGDTLKAHPQADVESAGDRFGAATQEVPMILGNVREVITQLNTTQGTVGAITNGPLFHDLGALQDRAGRIANRLTGGRGTVGLVMRGGLTERANRVMARADSVRSLLSSGNGVLGRFHRDSTIYRDVADIQNELSLIRAQLDEPRGTAGRVLHDSALTKGVAEAEHQMTLLADDMKKHPLRYLSF
jgi:phospholipid/cholesterol/gamma-HCH transport system substrate-binding protein